MRREDISGKKTRRILKNICVICVFSAAFLFFSQKISFGGFFAGGDGVVNGFSVNGGDIFLKYEEGDSEHNPEGDPEYNPGDGPEDSGDSGDFDGQGRDAASSDGSGVPSASDEEPLFGSSSFVYETERAAEPEPAPESTPLKIDRVEDSQSLLTVSGVLGLNDVVLQPETDLAGFTAGKEAVTLADMDKLRDLEYLRSSFYTVAKETALTSADFDADRFVNTDLTIDNTVPGPKILIFHTHSYEMYADSDPNDPMDGVMGVGQALAGILEADYGIECLHHTGRYDVVDGGHEIRGAYERMEPEIEKILAANPSIQVAIDLHRDGVLDDRRLVVTENGVQMAQIMFFNGLCKLMDDGTLKPIPGLQSPYIQTNLAFSFMAQFKANALYPEFTRRIYLNAYRYSLNMLPKSMLVEVGAQTNTKQEALNAMYPLADVLASVLMG